MLNQRCILPLKVATALTLAIVSALWLGWERPYWAGFAVIVMAATETSGHSLKKGRHRLLGTLLGVLAAFTLVGLFAQQPLAFLVSYSLFAAVCIYLQGHPRNGYIWTICLMVCSLVVVMGKLLPELTFSMAVLRVQETVLGILCFTLVFSLLWPSSSRHVVISTLKLYFEHQSKQLQTAIAELDEHSTFTKKLTFSDSLKQLTRLEDLLYAASADSYHIARDLPQWQTLLNQLHQWALLCGHLAEVSTLTKDKMTPEQSTVIASLLERLNTRARSALAMLEDIPGISGADIPVTPREVFLLTTPPIGSVPACGSRDHHGATILLGSLLTDIDRLQFNILTTLTAVTDSEIQVNAQRVERSTSKSQRASSKNTIWCFRPDSAINALKACLVIWICIALWILVPMPGGAMIVLLGAILSSVVFSLPFANVRTLLFSMFGWSLFVLAQYVLLMPMLTEVWQLSAFYFINAFVIWYVLHQPQQALQRMLGTQLLIMMTSGAMQLTPVYDIQSGLLQLMLIGIVMLVVFFVNYFVFSGTPESTFLRDISRFRFGLQQDLQSLKKPNVRDANQEICSVRKRFVIRKNPLRSVTMAENAAHRINWAVYPEVNATRVQAVITNAYQACLLYRVFEDNYKKWRHSSHHHALDGIITGTIESLSTILESTTISEEITPHQYKLDALLSELQGYLIGLDSESVLQFSLSPDNVDASYRMLTSLKLLISSLKALGVNVQNSEIHYLRLQPFAI
ncbi:FUSC family protein [Photobacterium sp. DNB22_13_2]